MINLFQTTYLQNGNTENDTVWSRYIPRIIHAAPELARIMMHALSRSCFCLIAYSKRQQFRSFRKQLHERVELLIFSISVRLLVHRPIDSCGLYEYSMLCRWH